MESKEIVFTLDEVNQMLTYLGEVPSRYSMDLINFIRGKAQEQIGDAPGGDAEPAAE